MPSISKARQQLPGLSTTVYSFDTLRDNGTLTDKNISLETLHAYKDPLTPPHEQRLKPNYLVIVIRNDIPASRIYNGTDGATFSEF